MQTREAAIRDLYTKLFEAADLDLADLLVTPEFVDHASPAPGSRGPEHLKATVRFLHGIFGNIRYAITEVITEGDRTAFRATLSADQIGDMFGFPATGKRFTQEQVHLVRFEGDRIAEHWACRDDLGALIQLGHISAG